MADMAKQRLVGALLVLAVILVAAFFLVKNANDQVEETTSIALPDNNVPIESVEPEQLEDDPEVTLDPHGLGQDVAAMIEDKAVLEAIDVESKAVEKMQQAEQKTAEKVTEVVKEIEQKPVQSTVKMIKSEPKKPVVEAPKETKPVSVSKPPSKTTEAKETKPAGPQWYIQLASFSVKDNALGLQKSVKKLGYESELQAAENSKGKMIYRVRIGPVSDQSKVDTIVAKVKQHLRLQPQVIKR